MNSHVSFNNSYHPKKNPARTRRTMAMPNDFADVLMGADNSTISPAKQQREAKGPSGSTQVQPAPCHMPRSCRIRGSVLLKTKTKTKTKAKTKMRDESEH
jgi:hypothetical protein